MKLFLKTMGLTIVCAAAVAVPRVAYPFAMGTIGSIQMRSANVYFSSFDSGDTNYSTGGMTDPAKMKVHGDVVAAVIIFNSILNVSGAHIAGHLETGPSVTIQIGTNGSVGSKAW